MLYESVVMSFALLRPERPVTANASVPKSLTLLDLAVWFRNTFRILEPPRNKIRACSEFEDRGYSPYVKMYYKAGYFVIS